MQVFHLRASDYRVSTWAGGRTTELFLWPREGSYADRRFSFRLSSATVEKECSVFTSLPGIRRYITPLDGGFTLIHRDHYQKKLRSLEIDSFWGDWHTECVGKATDLNLMLNGQPGTMEVFAGSSLTVVPHRGRFEGFYALGDGEYGVDGKSYLLYAGELLILHLSPADGPVSISLPPHPSIHISVEE